MNFSSSGRNATPAVVRDDLNTAILKNVITVTLCIFINYINATLVFTFIRHQIFKMNPRYILYIHLVINDISLLTILTLIQVLSYIVYTINVSLCIFLILIAIFSNFGTPVTLAVMAIECYIAVCFPLHYSQICTVKKTYIVIGIIWGISALGIVPDIFIALATERIEFFHSRAFCLKSNVIRMPLLDQKDTVFRALVFVIVWVTLVYIYFKIIFTAKSASSNARKARNTVILHSFQLMLSMLTYINNPISLGLTALFPQSVLAIRFAVAIIVNILPRLISPLVYGIRDKTFRKYLKQYLFWVRK